jgi:hypothetical protein
MTSIYQQALGSDFARLHPQIQRRFGLSSQSGLVSVGSGTMDEIWHGPPYTVPFLYTGLSRHIMFPERGRNVPFSIKNYAYVDAFGRETVTWLRTFDVRPQRHFDAYMIFSPRRGCIVDYLGTHQHLAVDLELSVNERGGLCIRSGAQRFYERALAFSFPLFFSGVADVCEWYDDECQRFRISVNVSNRYWGPLFGYHGSFEVEWRPAPRHQLPSHCMPRRIERRE